MPLRFIYIQHNYPFLNKMLIYRHRHEDTAHVCARNVHRTRRVECYAHFKIIIFQWKEFSLSPTL